MNYTTIEQSKKLTEILPLESADMYIYKNVFFGALSCFNGTTQIGEYIKLTDKESKAYPCWSLAALLGVLSNYQLQTQDDGIGVLCSCNGKFNIVTADNPVDACYEMIVKLHELNLL